MPPQRRLPARAGRLRPFLACRALVNRPAGFESLPPDAADPRTDDHRAAIKAFLSYMSHELRTPLNAIIGFAELLEEGSVPPDSPKHREFLGHIGSSGRHLLQLINDVLELSRIDAGELRFAPVPCRLSVLVQEVKDLLHTDIARRRLRVVDQVDPGIDEVVLDPARLKQVLCTYVSTALKFSAEGGCVTMRIRAEAPDRFRVEVADEGTTLPQAELIELFCDRRPIDGGAGSLRPGYGLSLPLARRLVEAQGGSVGVQRSPGRGSVFHLVLDREHRIGEPRDGAGSARTMPCAG